MKEHTTPYTITYSAPDGAVKTTALMWADALPTEEEVALALRDQLFGSSPLVLTDSPRNHVENTTVRQLGEAGFVILHICERVLKSA